MKSKLDIRVGDVVRLLDFKVTAIEQRMIAGDYVGGGRGYVYPLEHVVEVISRAETPEETIARLEAELGQCKQDCADWEYQAKTTVGRKIEWGGGLCPTDEAVVVWYRNGKTSQAMGYAFDWRHRNETDDIIAYMVLPS